MYKLETQNHKLVDGNLQFFYIDHETCKSIFLQQARRSPGLALQRGWAELMPVRCRDLVQHPNQPRPTAAEAADGDGEEARTFYYHPLAMRGRPLKGGPCLGVPSKIESKMRTKGHKKKL